MKIIRNYIYNVSYQILTIILPLITGPYVSRVLGSKGVGINSYTYSIVQWFVLFGSIGISLYGNRQIAYERGNIYRISQTFWELQILKFFTITIAYVAFLFYLTLERKYDHYLILQSIYIISAGLDISWLYMGLEDFKKTVVRNTIVKITSVIMILMFVRTKNDIGIYIVILSVSTLMGNLTLWSYVKKTLVKVSINQLRPFKHLKMSISLFIPLAAIQLYVSLNKTMLGVLDSTVASGFYDKSDSIIKMLLTIVTSLSGVLLPHTSKAFSEGKNDEVKNLLYNSFDFVSFLSFPLAFGLAAISLKFGTFFYGDGFNPVGKAMLLESMVIIFISWASITGNQYLIPTNSIREYTHSVFAGATVNVLLNIPLIKIGGLDGAIVATVFSEGTVTLYQVFVMRKKVNFSLMFKNTYKYLLSSLLMFSIVFWLNIKLRFTIYSMMLEIIIGVVTYAIGIFILKPTILKKIKKLKR